MRLAIHECTVHNGTEPIVLRKNSKQMSNMRVWFGLDWIGLVSVNITVCDEKTHTNKYTSKSYNITLEPTFNCDVTHFF